MKTLHSRERASSPAPRRIGIACPLCGEVSRRHYLVSGYEIRQCRACEHEFVPLGDFEAADAFDDSYFTRGGAGYADYLDEAVLLLKHGRRYGTMLARHMAPGRLLDVGTAAGFVLAGLVEAGWSGIGLEPNHSMAAIARERFGLQVEEGWLESFSSREQFDLVTMIQVVGHFYDVKRALSAAAAATRRGGFWLIETWNRESVTARTLGRHWHEYSPPTVRHIFSMHGLDAYVKRHGFLPVARGRPKKYLLAKHLKAFLAYKARESAVSRSVLRVANLLDDSAAIWYPAEDLFWTLYRKS